MPKLAANATLSVIDKLERKISGKGLVRAGKRFTLFISNEDINDMFKILELLEKSGLLFECVTETVKRKIKT